MEWIKDELNNERVSLCGRFKITKCKFSDTYFEFVLWERGRYSVRIPTGRKRNPFDDLEMEMYCKIVAQGTHRYVRDRANEINGG